MKQLAILQSRRFSRETQALVNTILECLLALAAKVEDNSPRELEQGFEFPWGHQDFASELERIRFERFLGCLSFLICISVVWFLLAHVACQEAGLLIR